ncbi:MAG: flagellar motor protein MotB [Rhodocyclaceae bacterium]|jgi:outer membrane protein OmpA-like peptidoglycan-associated protein|nr:flagellar motor protein MotB [Rhodocyclaceae bacterium]
MLGIKTPNRRQPRDEAEKPFWISFSDLMTALMVLFLVAMAVALMAVTQGLRKIEQEKKDREETIKACVSDIEQITQKPEFKGVRIRGHAIEFGSLAEFSKNGNDLSPERREFLRRFVPQVLEVARHESCQKWLKRVVVEGFASQEGSYLYNLNLSLERSQRTLCVLLDASASDAPSKEDRKLIRTLFLVGGSSFNSVKKSPEESRRVELRLEFKDLRKECPPDAPDCQPDALPDIPWDEDSKCPVTSR